MRNAPFSRSEVCSAGDGTGPAELLRGSAWCSEGAGTCCPSGRLVIVWQVAEQGQGPRHPDWSDTGLSHSCKHPLALLSSSGLCHCQARSTFFHHELPALPFLINDSFKLTMSTARCTWKFSCVHCLIGFFLTTESILENKFILQTSFHE